MVQIDLSRDALFTEFGLATVLDRYLLPGETSPQHMYARVADLLGDEGGHAQRIYDYMSKHWFSPATPILSNAGGDGMLISCFLNSYPDSMAGIRDTWSENADLASLGGGIGSYIGDVRSQGEKVGLSGKTTGIIPFMKVQDSMALGISQGLKRRGSSACYLPVWHPEIEEFLNVRKPHGGDVNRKCLNLHCGVVISDAFMGAVLRGDEWALLSPKTGERIKTVSARELWAKILETRLETGEPYLLFIDTVNRAIPEHHRKLGLLSTTSNLCCEITLPVTHDRTAVCCLSSLNLEKYDEWKDEPLFVRDVLQFLDNVLSHFIHTAPETLKKAINSARKERSVGLGVMGFHGFLQSKGIPFGSAMAKVWNKRIFAEIRGQANAANTHLGLTRGSNWDYLIAEGEKAMPRRFSYMIAIAPTASISTICGGSSPGIDPFAANSVTHKTLSGSFVVKNKYLEAILEKAGLNTEETWSEIIANAGSVAFLAERGLITKDCADVFATAFEIDQRWVVEHAANRAPYIDQSQSVNLFLRPDVSKQELHDLHFAAWKKGVKSLYYLRSLEASRAENVSKIAPSPNVVAGEENKECLACQ